ncbi:MAG: class I SAM-dependent methyltransferase [Rubrivivax sp.]
MHSANPRRVGVFVPTYNRPDLARACVLQLLHQSCPPDLICVHQNGSPESYAWAVADLGCSGLIWLHSPARLRQHDWYLLPLQRLLAEGCTHFFWADHDDIYLHEHIALGLQDLATHDFSVSRRCGQLYLRSSAYSHVPEVDFQVHAPGGMSSSMCFTRPFALQLAADMAADRAETYTDNVVAKMTMPRFNTLVSQRQSTVYVSHEGSLTSAGWLDAALPRVTTPPRPGFGVLFDRGTGQRSHKWRHYFEIYDRHFEAYRGQACVYLELGVERGGSLDIMREYLGAAARIVGVDIDPACQQLEQLGHEIHIGSQSDAPFLEALGVRLGALDIVLDDGGHTPDQQITSFYALFPRLRDGGVYVVESMHANLWASHQTSRYGITFFDLAKALADKPTYRHMDPQSFNVFGRPGSALAAGSGNFATEQIRAVHFYDSVIVIEKGPLPAAVRERR